MLLAASKVISLNWDFSVEGMGKGWFVCTHMPCKKTVGQRFGLLKFVLILSLSRFGLQPIDLPI